LRSARTSREITRPFSSTALVLNAAAEPSVLAGTQASPGRGVTSRQLVEHNLLGTVNLLELAARWGSGFVMISTSRVYSIAELSALPLATQLPNVFDIGMM
jgi:CDP-paratose 2-epimerase